MQSSRTIRPNDSGGMSLRVLSFITVFYCMFTVASCRTTRSDDSRPMHASELPLQETKVDASVLNQAQYLSYQGVDPFDPSQHKKKGFQPENMNPDVLQCAKKALGSFVDFMKQDDDLTVETFQQSEKVVKQFTLLVSDYTQASPLVRRRDAKVWFSASQDSQQNTWIWGVTAYYDRQGLFHCELPVAEQVLGAFNDKLGIDAERHRRIAENKRYRRVRP